MTTKSPRPNVFFSRCALFIFRAKFERPDLEIEIMEGDVELGPVEISNSILRAVHRPRFGTHVLGFSVGHRLGEKKQNALCTTPVPHSIHND